MSIVIPSVRINAPYVYLAKGPQDLQYVLFVHIPLRAGTIARRTSPANTSQVVYVVEDGDNPLAAPFYERIFIDTPVETLLENWADEFGIREGPLDNSVVVRVDNNSSILPGQGLDIKASYKTNVIFKHADTEDAPGGTIAYNCPYIYLTNPNAEIGITNPSAPDFIPRCHIPLQGTDYNSAAQPPADILTKPGSCLQQVNLFASPTSAKKEVLPNDISSNGIDPYLDNNLINGEFVVTVTTTAAAAAPPSTRRLRLKNRSSDTNPNGFIQEKDYSFNL